MNREYSKLVIEKLLSWGVSEFYICAGARDIPLIESVCNIKNEKKIVFNHFEERSAAFYALGRIKSIRKPVAVITTSGTAVGEMLPAVMEAYYSGLPLVLITADRPKSYRGTGAPQAAEQNNIFGIYVSKCLDLVPEDAFELSDIPFNRPLHINICFDIPLQSGNLEEIDFKKYTNNCLMHTMRTKFSTQEKSKFESFIRENKNILVIVSNLDLNNNENVLKFINKLNLPVYIESTSNFRECEELNHLKIKCGDKIWINSQKSEYNIDAVLKIGGTPTHRIWRDLDESKKHIKVLSLSENIFPGMPNAYNINTDINYFLSQIDTPNNTDNLNLIEKFLELDRISYSKLIELFNLYPKSEQSLFYHISNLIKNNSRVFLGNSLPIRNWDLAATYECKNLHIQASRGLNGIDGQISSFIGFCEEKITENWGFFGDLTTLYDLSGFWMLHHRPDLKINFIIINNGGGKIFNNVLKGEIAIVCQNLHNLDFQSIAKFWNLKYEKVRALDDLLKFTESRIIEVIPDIEETKIFATELSKI